MNQTEFNLVKLVCFKIGENKMTKMVYLLCKWDWKTWTNYKIKRVQKICKKQGKWKTGKWSKSQRLRNEHRWKKGAEKGETNQSGTRQEEEK